MYTLSLLAPYRKVERRDTINCVLVTFNHSFLILIIRVMSTDFNGPLIVMNPSFTVHTRIHVRVAGERSIAQSRVRDLHHLPSHLSQPTLTY